MAHQETAIAAATAIRRFPMNIPWNLPNLVPIHAILYNGDTATVESLFQGVGSLIYTCQATKGFSRRFSKRSIYRFEFSYTDMTVRFSIARRHQSSFQGNAKGEESNVVCHWLVNDWPRTFEESWNASVGASAVRTLLCKIKVPHTEDACLKIEYGTLLPRARRIIRWGRHEKMKALSVMGSSPCRSV
jgi:hypothetical protein